MGLGQFPVKFSPKSPILGFLIPELLKHPSLVEPQKLASWNFVKAAGESEETKESAISIRFLIQD